MLADLRVKNPQKFFEMFSRKRTPLPSGPNLESVYEHFKSLATTQVSLNPDLHVARDIGGLDPFPELNTDITVDELEKAIGRLEK